MNEFKHKSKRLAVEGSTEIVTKQEMTKKIIEILSGIFSNLFVKVAFDKLTNPQIRKLREREIEVLRTSVEEEFIFEGFKIKTYEWKGSKEGVLLIHGWEGQAGNFSDLILKLKKLEFNVYAFDAPSHGFSSKGKTSLFEFADLVSELIKKHKVRKLISHSFGGVATTFALFKNRDIEIDKYALITTPDRFIERINDVSIQYGINKKVIKKLINKLEKDYEIIVDKLNVSDFVKEIKVKKSIIFHDRNDRVIPIERSRNVHKNWKQSTFKEVEGTGHFRILRDEDVLDRVVEFIR